ncbi:ROK family transcriptional regulator [Tranquillimonas alkanivorans]|uniref:Sugar kinase of the NBD/HSP70 family, may contain an N-terminal HTH domain n=1 Tax=Tranquillimonas alkanivorans TaxID=441119 RepID=A0A1I5KIU7_9RHOB|nr:ROK family transcriptional regulator [Tranquillimonas alkanivorans]SFO84471.1 Sugar kinase of the NBD/HSP70 family, may contain an N-terminal HTH domain [Tranquillimonas alkanivorans]
MADELIDLVTDSEPAVGCGPLSPQRAAGDAAPLRQQVFDCVRAQGRLSRADVARCLGVSPGSVTAATGELIAAGYLEEVEPPRESEGGRGRPPVSLAVRPQAGFVAGIKVSSTAHTAVIHDFAGRAVADVSVPAAAARLTLDQTLEQTARLLDDVLAKAGLPRERILAVGLGVPGFIESDHGIVLWSPLIDGANLPLREAAQARLGLPVTIDNDANLVTLAELWFGDGRGVGNFAVVTIEHGVGMGLVLNNRLYRGARGLGTELGHTKVHLDGALCRCGQRGCLEAYVADYALVREASTALDWVQATNTPPAVLLETLYDHAKGGNVAARSIFKRAGRYLALGLANVVNLFDPELVILSGERMRYDYLYADEVLAEMQATAIQIDRPAPRVEIHAWGDLIWARGAAALALSQVTAERLGPAGLVAAQ